MRRALILCTGLAGVLSLGACASTPKTAETAPQVPAVQAVPSPTPGPGIPTKLLPNEGKTSSRKAGFGAAGDFVR